MSDAFSERLRLIRFRRKRERAKFTQELRVIPRWLVWTCLTLYILAIIIGMSVNGYNMRSNGTVFPDDSFRSMPFLSDLALAGAITGVAIFVSIFLFMLGYVYRDAKRRGMNPALWTLLVLILSPAYMFNARFNFCPNCKYNLHPACPQCQREVSDHDKFCPFCATELIHGPKPSGDAAPATNP